MPQQAREVVTGDLRMRDITAGKPVGVVSIGTPAIERDSDSALADISAAPDNTEPG